MKPEFFPYSLGDAAVRERVVDRSDRWDLVIAHVVIPPGDSVPRHPTDAEVFVAVVRGTLSLPTAEGMSRHGRGAIVHLPTGFAMEPRNEGAEALEFFVVKTPHPAR